MVRATPKSTGAPKPARSKTRAAATTPKAARKATTSAVKPETSAPAISVEDPKELTKKELVERLVTETGMKKGDARRALEAVLGVLNGALAEGANIAAAPLGKVKITRSKETENGQLVVCRVKLKKPQTASSDI